MSDSNHPKPIVSDDALPPVEPPSAGFLVQLFLIPGVIVVIIVAVWLLFHWLAQMGNDPRKYIQQLRGHGETRWQAAVNLAGALSNPANVELRSDPAIAQNLADILRDEIAGASTEERQVNLRVYLCLALSQLDAGIGLPVLLEAATTERDQAESAVRLAALKAIGDLASGKAGLTTASREEVLPVLLQGSHDSEAPLRAAAALALGALGGPEADKRLIEMLHDDRAEVRYDVALALANRGNTAALGTLVEMLDEDQSLAVAVVPEGLRQQQETLIHVGALRGLARLADANPSLDLSKAAGPLQSLTASDVPEVRDNALAVQEKLARRGAK